MVLPEALENILTRHLSHRLQDVRAIGGGGINQAAHFAAGDQSYLVKWHHRPPQPPLGWPEMFEAEARGLHVLDEAGTVRVPHVYTFAECRDGVPSFILLEWIATAQGRTAAAGEALGRSLAALHRVGAEAYGLDHNNYCGATPQWNEWSRSWLEFYGQRRLGYQMELAGRKGRMAGKRRRRLEQLIALLDRWIDEATCQPSLLHGDLWGGNWLVAARSDRPTHTHEPVIIDPAIYYGDREAELAMCHLFGGFPSEFFRAYDETWPPAPGRDERIPLYQLYHALNHLNLFGESYGGHVDGILRRYVG